MSDIELRQALWHRQIIAPLTASYLGWRLVGAGVLIQVLIGGLLSHAYGVYMVLLQQDLGWGKTALAAAYSLVHLESGLVGPAQAWLIRRWGARAVMGAGMLSLGFGFIGFSQVHRVGPFLISLLLMAVGASLAGYMSICVTVVNWFQRRRSRALSLLSLGGALAGLVLPLVVFVIHRWGWRAAALSSGILFLSGGLGLTRLFWDHPEDRGVSSEEEFHSADEKPLNFTTRDVVTTSAFWLLSVGHATAVLLLSAVTVHLVPHLTETLGFSLRAAGFAVSAVTAAVLLGIALGGFISDRFSKRWMAASYMLMHAGALLCLAAATHPATVALFAVLQGVAWGARGPLMQAIRAEYFGQQAYGRIFGLSSLVIMVGAAVGPVLTGLLYESLGGYRPAFTGMALVGVLGAALFASSRPPQLPAV